VTRMFGCTALNTGLPFFFHRNSIGPPNSRTNSRRSRSRVLVRQQERAATGRIAVALVDGAATIKRLAKAPGYRVLQPEATNPKHRPILIGSKFSDPRSRIPSS
jgi:hypothetical protein